MRQGLGPAYEELSALQTKRLRDEAGIRRDEIGPAACSMLEEAGVDTSPLRDDPRLRFLF